MHRRIDGAIHYITLLPRVARYSWLMGGANAFLTPDIATRNEAALRALKNFVVLRVTYEGETAYGFFCGDKNIYQRTRDISHISSAYKDANGTGLSPIAKVPEDFARDCDYCGFLLDQQQFDGAQVVNLDPINLLQPAPLEENDLNSIISAAISKKNRKSK